MHIESLTVGAFEENCWLLHDFATGEVVLIDPGDEAARIVAAVERTGGRLSAIWLTHAHLDHIGALPGVLRTWPGTPVHMHPADRRTYEFAPTAARMYGIPFELGPVPDRELGEGQILAFGAHRFEVWHLPGHAMGHVAFIGGGHCFGGDVLFAGSIGRTDLPGCDSAAMERSLERLLTLPAETIVHPGHGPDTTIGKEAQYNPFLNGAARIPRSRGAPRGAV